MIEQLSEIDVLLQVAEEMGVQPTAGVRIKLATEGSGRWAKSGGEKSKFGLSAVELMKLLDKLERLGPQGHPQADPLPPRQPDHRHPLHQGGTPGDRPLLRRAAGDGRRHHPRRRRRRARRGLRRLELDPAASVNYSLQEYANDVVYTIAERVPRARAADAARHQRVGPRADGAPRAAADQGHRRRVADRAGAPPLREDAHPLLLEMTENLEGITSPTGSRRSSTTSMFAKERAQELFASGVFSLRDKADAEQIYLATLNALQQAIGDDKTAFPRSPRTSTRRWSTATSATSRSSSRCPTAGRSTSSSRSCRSTGSTRSRRGAARFRTSPATPTGRSTGSSAAKGKPSLELHPVTDGEPYMLGIFLTGAYQEILGDLHNLFGDTNAVHIRLTEQGYEVTDLVHGDTVTEVLNYVQFRGSDLLATFRRKVGNAKD